MQTTFDAAGASLRLLFSHVPLPWQPGVMLIGSVAAFLLLVTCFRYRLSLPFWFLLEPSDSRDGGECEKCQPNNGQNVAKPVKAKQKPPKGNAKHLDDQGFNHDSEFEYLGDRLRGGECKECQPNNGQNVPKPVKAKQKQPKGNTKNWDDGGFNRQ
jgi:hypothetical protein